MSREFPHIDENFDPVPGSVYWQGDLEFKEEPTREEREKLNLKLKQYQDRLEEQAINPKTKPKDIDDTRYKVAILNRLLATGKVVRLDILKDLSEVHGGVRLDAFDNAMTVIFNYITNEGVFNSKPLE